MAADSRKPRTRRNSSKRSKSRAKKPKVVLAQKKVYTMCALICMLCAICLGTNLALHKMSEEKLAEKTEQSQPEKKSVVAAQPSAQPSKNFSGGTSPSKSSQPAADSQGASRPKAAEKTVPQVQKKTEPRPEVKQVSSEVKKSAPANLAAPASKKSSQNLVASAKTPHQSEVVDKQIPKDRFSIPPAKNGATVVMILDDAGRSVENVLRYTSLPFPVTVAVLPGLSHSRQCADAVRRAGQEVILHQPMQAENLNMDPGPGAIKADMNTYAIAECIKKNLLELGPGVKGMNNHEGSLITANEIKIGAVLDVCAEENIYFLDSNLFDSNFYIFLIF